jgi:hypothetical protein
MSCAVDVNLLSWTCKISIINEMKWKNI